MNKNGISISPSNFIAPQGEIFIEIKRIHANHFTILRIDFYQMKTRHGSMVNTCTSNNYIICFVPYRQPLGNVGVVNNYLLQLDGGTGDIKNAYINGYGNINYSMEISYYTNMQLLHLTADNKLITTPQIGGIVYYPDATGNFKPYYTTCSNQLLPSQFMWVSFDLNNMKSYKRDEQPEETIFNQTDKITNVCRVYPNPSTNEFSILTGQPETFELFDLTGKMLDKFFVNENEPFVFRHTLPQGMYLLRGKESGLMTKVVVQ